jgi:hypothetical protein
MPAACSTCLYSRSTTFSDLVRSTVFMSEPLVYHNLVSVSSIERHVMAKIQTRKVTEFTVTQTKKAA